MRLNEIKRQAIGKYFFDNGFYMGKITDVVHSLGHNMLDVVTDGGRVNFIRKYHFARLLSGKSAKQKTMMRGLYNYYRISSSRHPDRDNTAIWSPGSPPIPSIWRYGSGLSIDEASTENKYYINQ